MTSAQESLTDFIAKMRDLTQMADESVSMDTSTNQRLAMQRSSGYAAELLRDLGEGKSAFAFEWLVAALADVECGNAPAAFRSDEARGNFAPSAVRALQMQVAAIQAYLMKSAKMKREQAARLVIVKVGSERIDFLVNFKNAHEVKSVTWQTVDKWRYHAIGSAKDDPFRKGYETRLQFLTDLEGEPMDLADAAAGAVSNSIGQLPA